MARDTDELCKDCRFFQPHDEKLAPNLPQDGTGECRIGSPCPMRGADADGTAWRWPVVRPSHWCGGWRDSF